MEWTMQSQAKTEKGEMYNIWQLGDIWQVTKDANPPKYTAGYFDVVSLLKLKNCTEVFILGKWRPLWWLL